MKTAHLKSLAKTLTHITGDSSLEEIVNEFTNMENSGVKCCGKPVKTADKAKEVASRKYVPAHKVSHGKECDIVYVVCPNTDKSCIEVLAHEGMLIITRKNKESSKPKHYTIDEVMHADFILTFPFSEDDDQTKIVPSLQEGILIVKVFKKEIKKPASRSFEIK